MKTLTVESLAKENAKNKTRIGEREREREEGIEIRSTAKRGFWVSLKTDERREAIIILLS